jgi:NADPH:quinone reductase and related Zn-dependent oxidoreductases
MKAIRVEGQGGPEVLRIADVPDPVAGPGEALVKVEAIGVNFIEVYQRSGLYQVPLPMTPGGEAAGTVASIGSETTTSGIKVGDRVAWQGVPGAYAEMAKVPADKLVKIPDGVSTDQAAAVMLQGMTAHYLATSTYQLKSGDTCLFHAAAGGVGLLFCQIASHIGARVIGTTSTPEKAALAKQAGAWEIIDYTKQDFAAEVRRLTNGSGVPGGVRLSGQDNMGENHRLPVAAGNGCLLRKFERTVPPIDPLMLMRKGSLFMTRPTLNHYVASRNDLLLRANAVLNAVASGNLKVRIEKTFPLAEAGAAHTLLESRKTAGKVLLRP